jgi:hypothetical protein
MYKTLFEEDFFKSYNLDAESGVLIKAIQMARSKMPEGSFRVNKRGIKYKKVGGKWKYVGKVEVPKQRKKKGEIKSSPAPRKRKIGSLKVGDVVKRSDVSIQQLEELGIANKNNNVSPAQKRRMWRKAVKMGIFKKKGDAFMVAAGGGSGGGDEPPDEPKKKKGKKGRAKRLNIGDKVTVYYSDRAKKTGDTPETTIDELKSLGIKPPKGVINPSATVRAMIDIAISKGYLKVVLTPPGKNPLGRRDLVVMGIKSKSPKRKGVIVDPSVDKYPADKIKSYKSLGKMSIKEMAEYAWNKHNAKLEVKSASDHDVMANTVHQLDVMKSQGYSTIVPFTIKVERGYHGQAKKGVKAFYKPESQVIVLGNDFINSFAHEYFHHLDYQAAPNHESRKEYLKAKDELWAAMRKTNSYSTFEMLDKNKTPYYSTQTEMIARLGSHIMYLKTIDLSEEWDKKVGGGVDSDVDMADSPSAEPMMHFSDEEVISLKEKFDRYIKGTATRIAKSISGLKFLLLKGGKSE